MSGKDISPNSIDILKQVSVATLATALYKRGLRNQVIQDVHPVGQNHGKKSVSGAPNMVGPAFTLRYMPAREDRNTLAEFQNPQHPQRQAIEQCPEGHVLVMDSRKDARAASAGDILITRLMMRGGAGVVTDGGFRDSDSIAELDMPAYHSRPASPTNLRYMKRLILTSLSGAVMQPYFRAIILSVIMTALSSCQPILLMSLPRMLLK